MLSKEINEKVYKPVFDEAFAKIRRLKDGLEENSNKSNSLITAGSLFEIGAINEDDLDFIKESINEATENALKHTVIKLLAYYKSPGNIIPVKWETTEVQSVDIEYEDGNKETFEGRITSRKNGIHLLYEELIDDKRILFVFKKFGNSNMISKAVINSIKNAYEIDDVKVISFVKDGANSELIGSLNAEIDPNSTCNIYSYKYYLENRFGKEEYERFSNALESFNKSVNDYLGLKTVRTLNPNTLFGYKKVIKKRIMKKDFSNIAQEIGLSVKELDVIQINAINNQFIDGKYYEAMLGNKLFAQSFLTAEWLYDSLENAGYIDFTAIAMGYLKSVEQLLFTFMSFYTVDRTGKKRTTDAGNERYLTLTDDLLEKKKDYINLGNMTGFFTRWKNRDLLRDEIVDGTFELIKAIFDDTKELRNEYFHKHNFVDWNEVKRIRNATYAIFYILLGAYDLKSIDYCELGIDTTTITEEHKLCEYINASANIDPGLTPKLFFIDTENGMEIYIAKPDPQLTFDQNGVPIYSGINFSKFKEKNSSISFSINNLPEQIYEGNLVVGINDVGSIKLDITGPERLIFDSGRFLL